MLRTVERSTLVAVADWVGPVPPEVTDPGVDSILRQYRHRYNGQLAICWYDGTPPAELVRIGRIPPSPEELAIDPAGRYCGFWHPDMARPVLLEGDSHTAAGSRSGPDPPDIPSPLPESRFWDLIALVDPKLLAAPDCLDSLVAALIAAGEEHLNSFEESLAGALHALDGHEWAAEIGNGAFNPGAYFSPDDFLYARCAVVAHGRERYTQVLQDPRRFPKDVVFEPLLQVADIARSALNPDAKPPVTSVSYETYSNTTMWQLERDA